MGFALTSLLLEGLIFAERRCSALRSILASRWGDSTAEQRSSKKAGWTKCQRAES